MLLGASLKMFGLVLFVIPGLIAAQLFPGIAPDTAYSTLTRELLPVGMSGLVLAGMIAALMSSQDSGINAMASIVSIDIYPAIRKNATEREGVLVGKSIAVANIIWGVAAAPMFLTVEQGIFDLMLKFGGFLMMPNGLCYLIGRYWRRGNEHGAVAALLCGAVLGAYYIVMSTLPGYDRFLPGNVADIHYYHLLPIFGAILTVIFIVVSLLTPAPAPEKLDFLKPDPSIGQEPVAPKVWYKRYGFWWALYLAAFVGLYLVF